MSSVCKSCTVLIWKDGSKKSYMRALKLEIPVSSPLWIQECVQRNQKADYASYPVKINEFQLNWFKVKSVKKENSPIATSAQHKKCKQSDGEMERLEDII